MVQDRCTRAMVDMGMVWNVVDGPAHRPRGDQMSRAISAA
jgi:hypothetical protein